MGFQRLVRFADSQGSVKYGDLGSEVPPKSLDGVEVEILEGDFTKGFSGTGRKEKIHKLLSPLPDTPHVIGIGLNYQKHATEAKLTVPEFPVIFVKGPNSLAGPLDDISIHPTAQEQLDYEGELTIVIGKDAKNVPESEALDYILGYTTGNDISARYFSHPSRSGGQYCYSKGFDGFGPIGPTLVSPSLVPDPQKLQYTTKVNGELRQQTETSDMIWTVAQIIAHASKGHTLLRGTVIMTGTPSGVALFMDPPKFLKDGDVVEIDIEGIGAIRNKMVFEKA